MPQSRLEKRRIDGFPFHRMRTTSPRQCHSYDSKGILRRLIRQKKDCHKEHKGTKYPGKLSLCPWIFLWLTLQSKTRISVMVTPRGCRKVDDEPHDLEKPQ